MSETELMLPGSPRRVRYAVPGLYLACEIGVESEEGTLLLSSDGTDFDFTVAEPGAHTLCVMAPADAVVSLNGTALEPSLATATVPYATQMDISGELKEAFPGYLVYSFGGLYGEYEATATLNGAVLSGELSDGVLTFAIPGNEALREELHERVESYLMQVCRYGAGGYNPADYCVPGSDAAEFFNRAVYSVYWVTGTGVTFDTVEAYDFVPAGEDAFICKGHVVCTSTTNFNSWDLDMYYEMLWVRSGNTWLVQDFAYL